MITRRNLSVFTATIALACLLSGCSAWTRWDLARICKVFGERRGGTPAERAESLYRELDGLWLGPNGRGLIHAMPMADNATRYDLMLRAASDAGLSDWECPAARDYLMPEPTQKATGGGGGE